MARSLNVSGLKEARAAVTALRVVDADLRDKVNAQVSSVVRPVWTGEVNKRATWKMHRVVLAQGAGVQAGVRPVLEAATSATPLRGGLVPARSWQGFEFGANRHERVTYSRRSKNGKTHQVTRKTRRQLPQQTKRGRVLYPAVAEVGPRFASLWAQTSVWLIYRALQKGAR